MLVELPPIEGTSMLRKAAAGPISMAPPRSAREGGGEGGGGGGGAAVGSGAPSVRTELRTFNQMPMLEEVDQSGQQQQQEQQQQQQEQQLHPSGAATEASAPHGPPISPTGAPPAADTCDATLHQRATERCGPGGGGGVGAGGSHKGAGGGAGGGRGSRGSSRGGDGSRIRSADVSQQPPGSPRGPDTTPNVITPPLPEPLPVASPYYTDLSPTAAPAALAASPTPYVDPYTLAPRAYVRAPAPLFPELRVRTPRDGPPSFGPPSSQLRLWAKEQGAVHSGPMPRPSADAQCNDRTERNVIERMSTKLAANRRLASAVLSMEKYDDYAAHVYAVTHSLVGSGGRVAGSPRRLLSNRWDSACMSRAHELRLAEHAGEIALGLPDASALLDVAVPHLKLPAVRGGSSATKGSGYASGSKSARSAVPATRRDVGVGEAAGPWSGEHESELQLRQILADAVEGYERPARWRAR